MVPALGALGLLAGAVAGSFLATILVRWPEQRSALFGRSACDHCHRSLSAIELVPLFSYALSKGACRSCAGSINSRHPAVELAAAAIGAVALVAHEATAGAIAAIFGWWLLLLALLDLEHHWLPDRLTLPLLPAGLAVGWAGLGVGLPDRIVGAAAGFLVLWTISSAYRSIRGRDGMGAADPKLLAAIGAWIGWQSLPLVLLGAGVVGLSAILLMQLGGVKVTAQHKLPLGTLMALPAWAIWMLTVGQAS
jgi:leader peptidase (prepilin peptidase)/N-methyltransferase